MFDTKILALVCCNNSLEIHTFFSWRKAALALPIRALTCASVLPFLSMMLLKYVKDLQFLQRGANKQDWFFPGCVQPH